MATKPLPIVVSSEKDAKVSQKLQQDQLAVFETMATLLTNINQNLSLIAVNILPETLKVLMDQTEMLDPSRSRKNELKEKESAAEAGLGAKPGKSESMFERLSKLFDEYFGIFKTIFNVLKVILLPLILGFIVGFRKKFDLVTVALAAAVLWPIKTFKFMKKVFTTIFNLVDDLSKNKLFKGAGKGLGKLLLPITIIMGIIDGIRGAIKGFEKGGALGAVRGAIVGITDGLIGWIVDIGQWLVTNLLEMLGFDELAKIVEKFNFSEFLDKYADFFNPFIALLDMFDENSRIRQNFRAALDRASKVGDFVANIWDAITEAVRTVLSNIAEALNITQLMSALGLKGKGEIAKSQRAGPLQTMDAETKKEYDSIDTGNEQLDNMARVALESGDRELYEDLVGKGMFNTQEDTESAKKMMMERGGYSKQQIENIAQTGYGTANFVPAAPKNKAEELDQKTKEAEKAKQPTPVAPAVNNTTVVNAPNNSKTTANMNRELHADGRGLGSRGNAAVAGFTRRY